jgi:hypothetical protein
MLEQEYFSILKFLHGNNPVKLYEEEVLEDFIKPCMYFPAPDVIPVIDALDSFKNTYLLYINVIYDKTNEAMNKAHELNNLLMSKKLRIPLVDVAGNLTGKSLKLSKSSVEKIDVGIAQISIQWDSVYKFDTEIVGKINKFIISIGGK